MSHIHPSTPFVLHYRPLVTRQGAITLPDNVDVITGLTLLDDPDWEWVEMRLDGQVVQRLWREWVLFYYERSGKDPKHQRLPFWFSHLKCGIHMGKIGSSILSFHISNEEPVQLGMEYALLGEDELAKSLDNDFHTLFRGISRTKLLSGLASIPKHKYISAVHWKHDNEHWKHDNEHNTWKITSNHETVIQASQEYFTHVAPARSEFVPVSGWYSYYFQNPVSDTWERVLKGNSSAGVELSSGQVSNGIVYVEYRDRIRSDLSIN